MEKNSKKSKKKESKKESKPSWFEELMGFPEKDYFDVKKQIQIIAGNNIKSKANGKSYSFGKFERLSVGESLKRLKKKEGSLSVSSVVGDVQKLHVENENALFQVASQFNFLEMIDPKYEPEHGVGIYENDRTQGKLPCLFVLCFD